MDFARVGAIEKAAGPHARRFTVNLLETPLTLFLSDRHKIRVIAVRLQPALGTASEGRATLVEVSAAGEAPDRAVARGLSNPGADGAVRGGL